MNTMSKDKITCLICLQPNTELLYSHTRLDYSVFICKACNFGIRKYMPGKNRISEIYGQGYSGFLKTGVAKNGERIRNNYLENFEEKKAFIKLNGIANPDSLAGNKAYEIGFGLGEILDLLVTEGFRVSGCDLSRECFEIIKKQHKNVEYGFFEDLDLKKNEYALVIMWSMIEHFQNPREVLTKAYDILKPGGKIVIVGANFNSYKRKILGPGWKGFTAGHFYFFSPKAIRSLLGQCGFKMIKFYHPDNFNFIQRPQLINRIFKRLKFWILRGTLIQRTQKFFVVAQKPLSQ